MTAKRKDGGEGQAQAPAVAGEVVPAGRDVRARPIDLSTLRDVRRELASVYRDMRAGAIPSGMGTRLAFTLQVLGKLIEAEQFEARIDALEAAYRDDEARGEARPH